MATLTLKRLHCARIVLGKSGSSSEDPDVPVIPPSSEYATVTFVPGGDMDDMEIQVEIGTTISEIPAPTREGWEFQGWWSAEVGGIELDPSQPVQESATYYGHWTLIESPITYNMNGHGSVPEDALLVNSVAKMEDYTPPNPELLRFFHLTTMESSHSPRTGQRISRRKFPQKMTIWIQWKTQQ